MTFIEYSPVENTAFVYVTGLTYDEWGHVSSTELESIMLAPQVPRIERDMYFESVKFSKLKLKKARKLGLFTRLFIYILAQIFTG